MKTVILIKRISFVFLLGCSLAVAQGCGGANNNENENKDGKNGKNEKEEKKDGHEHEHDHHGPHGGHILEVGSNHEAHAEFVHDAAMGKAELYILDGAMKKEIKIKKAPVIKLITESGPVVINMTPAETDEAGSSKFMAADNALRAHMLKGRIDIEYNEKTYSPDIVNHEDHNH